MGAQDTSGVSVSLVATPTDNIKVTGFFSFTGDDDGAPTALAMKVAGTGPILNCNLGGTGGAWWCGALPDVNEFDPRNISAG